jgi:hypothetical protein
MALTPPATRLAIQPDEQDLITRVQREFRDMPGLTLTLPQAVRLFNLDRPRCERILGALVHAGHLTTDGRAFARPDVARRYE